MMKRREFGRKIVISTMGAGLSGSFAEGAASAQVTGTPQRNTLMHVGGDYHSVAGSGITSRENLQYNLCYGVKHLTVTLSKTSPEGAWDLDELKRMKDDCDHYGVQLEAIRMSPDYITLPKGPKRDRTLDAILGNIRKASEAGVKIITYHWTVIPIRRNTRTLGGAAPPMRPSSSKTTGGICHWVVPARSVRKITGNASVTFWRK